MTYERTDPAAARSDRPRGRRLPRAAAPVLLLGLGTLGLSACSSASGPDSNGGEDAELTIVTSTSVYADVAKQVAGEDVEVIPVIDSPSQDPHSYEAAPADRLTVEDADLIVMNGGGYDSFMDDLIGDSDVPVIDAVESSDLEGAEEAAASDHDHSDHEHSEEEHSEEEADHDHEHHHHHHSGFNEHVWYDLDTVSAVADGVRDELSELDPDGSQDYSSNADEFSGDLDELGERLDGIGADGDFLATEPVADHMLERAGLHDATPEDFTAAVEDGSDIPALTYAEVEDMITGEQIDLFAFNEHTASGQTEQLRGTAEDTGVPVVSFTETMPEGQSYLEWMGANVDAIEQVR